MSRRGRRHRSSWALGAAVAMATALVGGGVWSPAEATSASHPAAGALADVSSAGPGFPTASQRCGNYQDVAADNTHCANILWLTSEGITKPTDPRSFMPTRRTTRGEMVAFLFRHENPGQAQPECTSPPFADVPVTHQFCGYITWAKQERITTGVGDGTRFASTARVTRGETIAFLHRIMTEGSPQQPCSKKPFHDVPTSYKFCGYIAWAKDAHVTSGLKGGCDFAPARAVTRAEMASFVHRITRPGAETVECTAPTTHSMFSYGTLMKGQPASHFFDGTYVSYAQSSLGDAAMYYSSSGRFPFVVTGMSGTVKGELYHLKDSTANATITRIDTYERYDPGKPDSGQAYVRKKRRVSQGYDAWVYIAGPEQAEFLKSHGERIPSGDWRRR